jgi:hypothetical protein
MASFRTAVIVTIIVGFALGVLLGMSAGSDLGQPDVAMAADTSSLDGVLRGLVQTVSKPLMRALNAAAGPSVKVVAPGAKADRNTATTPVPGKGSQRLPKP